MPYSIGTSTNGHYDLLADIRTFVEATLPVAERYTVMRAVSTGDDHEVIWKAPGLSGTEEIFFGIKTYQSVSSDYYNFKVGTFTGYVAENTFETQPGSSTIKGVPLWNQQTPHWIVANGQRLVVAAKVENVEESFYLGKPFFHYTPFQYPYPVVCGAMLTSDSATRYSDTTHNAWFIGSSAALEVREIDGSWSAPDAYPYHGTRTLRNTITASGTAVGYYGIHPIELSNSDPTLFGELDGVFYISGFNNAVENTFTIDAVPYVVIRNVWRTGFKDYVALRLA